MSKSLRIPSRWDIPLLSHILLWLLLAALAFHLYNSTLRVPKENEQRIAEDTVWETEDLTTTLVSSAEIQKQRDLEDFTTTPVPSTEDNLRQRVVLYWTAFHGVPDYYVGFDNVPFRNCPISNCVTTNDRSQLGCSDAVIFHPHDVNLDDLPLTRPDDQRWIWLDHEPPFYCHRLQYPANMYNWTMTYRLDSDIVDGYGKVVPFRAKDKSQVVKTTTTADLKRFRTLKQSRNYDARFDYDSFIQNKTKSIAWVVSHCPTQSKRENYVRELSKYIDVDIYGRCGNLTCERKGSCMERIGREYKFYLSFENSLCMDYITEKFFRALEVGVVPVVFGVDAHKTLGPPDGYIDAMQFESPKALAAYLHEVMKNDTLYKEYLKWNDDMLPTGNGGWCDLCKMLNDPALSEKKSVYHDMDAWWFEKNLCFNPNW